MSGAELQAAMAKRLREFLASEACQFPLTRVSPLALTHDGQDYFTLSDGSYDYIIKVEFDDPR